MKVLLAGSGGREHAIAWKLSKSKLLKHLYIAPGNPGTAQFGSNVDIPDNDIPNLVNFAREKKIDLTIVGPEDPLAEGLVDAMNQAGIKAFGPDKLSAQLEADKAFAKKIMIANAVPTAEGHAFDNFDDARTFIATRDSALVVKAAGLAKGKGVFVCDDPADAINAAEQIMKQRTFGAAGDIIIVEEKLLGQEASILAFVDGRTIYVMESAQDHKPIGDGDTGPNTGGMGAYSPVPIVDSAMMGRIEAEVLVPIVDAMRRDFGRYEGLLYAGLMFTSAGPKVIEFNCRFGDPECQPLMMRLKSDLLEIMIAVATHRLDEMTIQWDPRPAVCVVMSSGGYPGDYAQGHEITGIAEADAMPDVKVFQAGTAKVDGKLVNTGGRVLGVTALGDTIADAQKRAYEAVGKITWTDCYFRHDIASKAIG